MNFTEIMNPGGFPDEMIKFIKVPDFLELVLRFTFNIAVIFVLIRLLYYPTARRKDYLFTYKSVSFFGVVLACKQRS